MLLKEEEKERLLVIVGATAVGKSELALRLAQVFNGEIISGDSVQVFRGFDIGSAKIKPHEMKGITHHLIDICHPSDIYSVYDFKENATGLITEINERKKLPIIVGGTGLYIQGVLFDYSFPKMTRDSSLRLELEQLTSEDLYSKLVGLDRVAAQNIHPHNKQRLLRAVEVCLTTGRPFSEQQSKNKESSNYNVLVLGLNMEREKLYDRIESRVDLMIGAGLEAEVFNLYKSGYESSQAFRGIGYKEFLPYFAGEYDREEVIRLIKRNSKRFAKRQYTWFRNQMEVEWCTSEEAIKKVKGWLLTKKE